MQRSTTKSRIFACIGLFLSLGLATSPAAEKPSHPTAPQLNEPERVIHRGDMVRITLRLPGRTLASLEPVGTYGDVATPEGSLIKAEGLRLADFRTELSKLYASASGYEEAQVEAYISSSPYAVIMYGPKAVAAEPVSKASTEKTTLATESKPLPPTIFRRNFESPLTVWEAIQREGGVPAGIDPHHIRILKSGLVRKTLNCSGGEGLPEGNTQVESGDYLFLVPDDVSASKIFD